MEIETLKIALAETVLLLVQRVGLSKREAVSHFQTLADQVMPKPDGQIGARVFEQIAGYRLKIPIKDD